MGAGLLALAEGVEPPRPLLLGGGQEGGLRSGTENVAGCVGLGVALDLAAAEAEAGAPGETRARAALEQALVELEGARVLAPGAARSPAILAALLPGPPAEVWMHHLEARGVMTSAGSACHAKKSQVSPALLALGLGADEARRVLRFSFARTTTVPEVLAAAAALRAVARELGAAAR
jgi:cysteine desulfurase